MFTLHSGQQRLCDGLPRRQFLTIGSLATVPWLTGAKALAEPEILAQSSFGRAKRCLLLFLTGGPPQLDTWDPKPDAPEQIRGELAPISTSVPGIFVSELFPKLAAHANRFRILRSLTHDDSVHTTAGYAMLTGAMHPLANKVASATMIRPGPEDRPHLSSLVQKFLSDHETRLPPFALPEIIKDAAVNEFPGLNAGFLSKRFDPLLIEANRERSAFLPPPVALPLEVPTGRMQLRVTLRNVLEGALRRATDHPTEALYQNAFALLQSTRLRQAFDLDQEPDAVRSAYGSHLFGQGALLARRLLEADAKFVTVYWHYEGPDDSPVWDTHWNNFQHLRERLAAPTDLAVSALLSDLSQRGLLDETLVLCLGEFGRSPRVNEKAGRDHWPQVANAIVAGAGIPGGTVVGASDREGAYPAHAPITPADWGATVLHRLGVRPEEEFHDQLGRPHRAGLGTIRPELFG